MYAVFIAKKERHEHVLYSMEYAVVFGAASGYLFEKFTLVAVNVREAKKYIIII